MRVSVPGMSRRKPSGIHVRTLHARVKLLTAGLVAIAVIVSASAVYIVFNAYLQGNVDRQLERTSDAITDTVNFGGVTPVLGLTAGADTAVIQAVGLLTADGALVTATPGLPPFSTSADAIRSIADGNSSQTIATVDAYRILVEPRLRARLWLSRNPWGRRVRYSSDWQWCWRHSGRPESP